MTERERDRRDEERGHIVNPAHPLADEVAHGLRQLRNEELAALAHQDKIAQQARPTQEERRSITELYEPAAQALGIDLERLVQRQREVGENELARIKAAQQGELVRPPKRVALDHEPPPPVDHSFWWAHSEWNWSKSRAIDDHGGPVLASRPDGFHADFTLESWDGDFKTAWLSLVSSYEVEPDRIPPSSTGLWRSAPYVELFGGIKSRTTLGSTGFFTYGRGDSWSKWFMHRRHTILQFVPGGNFPIIITEGREVQALIQEENKDKWVTVGMPGFQPMPQLRFGSFNPTQSLWAQLEVGFHIHLEGYLGYAGTSEPPAGLLLRGFQWPLEPNA